MRAYGRGTNHEGLFDYTGVLGEWTQLNADGFGTVNNIDSRCLAVYNGDLYVGTTNWEDGAQVWKYHDEAWTQVNVNGFGYPGDGLGGGICQVQSLVAYRGYLYAATYGPTSDPGGRVFRYNNTGTSWTQVGANGFGNVNNTIITALSMLDEKLYAGTQNLIEGCEVWTYDGAAITPSWTRIGNAGLGDVNHILVTNILQYDGLIYAGTGVVAGVGACGVFSYNGLSWTKVNTDGFGDGANWDSWSIETFLGYILVGTDNHAGCELWRYDGSTWIQIGTGGMGYANAFILDGLVTLGNQCYLSVDDWGGTLGAKLLRSLDSETWVAVGNPGLGDINNGGYYAMLVDGNTLYLSTYNTVTGCEIWKYNSMYGYI